MELDAFIQTIENRAKNTVGYEEAADKDAYLIGVRTAAAIAHETVKALESQVGRHDERRKEVLNDMRALVGTIGKYQYLNDSPDDAFQPVRQRG